MTKTYFLFKLGLKIFSPAVSGDKGSKFLFSMKPIKKFFSLF
jgi:hypothetical protein